MSPMVERRAKARALVTLLLVGTAVLAIAVGADAFSSGVDRQGAGPSSEGGGLATNGCSCHAKDPSPEVMLDVTGIPGVYKAGEKYPITIQFSGGPAPSADGNKGGFNLLVGEGALETVAGNDFVQIKGAKKQEATHTLKGDRESNRNFSVVWDSTGAKGPVSFVVTVNSVNGDGAPSADDLWNRKSFVAVPAGVAPETVIGAAAAHPEHITKEGVNYLAYWIGIISFLALFVIYGATFFLFKHGDTTETTDHKDRKA